ncbi:unnamed protein product, partial [Vitis vinifera]
MDYDDNDFQSQNLWLAGEGSAKFPPVLGPYALPNPCGGSSNVDGHIIQNSSSHTDNNLEKAEKPFSEKGLHSEFGRKPFVFNENPCSQ